nr:immunoglobulin heavy chain junction region [Macaca mulatta]MOV86851.1 immunoglobulin heavy chain junction region [Macaca mulatta]MOV87011.1 immunoglobulin heavy chain junction region [Macaca mulatta]MOV87972.1 immunoglobulin heavy chain junction region [Macaca mulatta]MOV88082.1 immunoglobulin heavy chain junction region [Macaca mulatta]
CARHEVYGSGLDYW